MLIMSENMLHVMNSIRMNFVFTVERYFLPIVFIHFFRSFRNIEGKLEQFYPS